MNIIIPVFENQFYNDGRDPDLQMVIWNNNGILPIGFEYFNPDDDSNLRHIVIEQVEAFSMTKKEVHGNILFLHDSKASIFEVVDSMWQQSLNPAHLNNCRHFQFVFYDEIFDVICKSITPGIGKIKLDSR